MIMILFVMREDLVFFRSRVRNMLPLCLGYAIVGFIYTVGQGLGFGLQTQ